MIAMEYMPRGELFDYVLERRGLNEGEAREMFVQIVEALDYCHKVRTTERAPPPPNQCVSRTIFVVIRKDA